MRMRSSFVRLSAVAGGSLAALALAAAHGCTTDLTATSSSSGSGGAGGAVPKTAFLVGAATADITPPVAGMGEPAAFSKCDKKYTGKRMFAFEEPYVDANMNGRFDDGEDFCDVASTNHPKGAGRYQGIFLAGGGGSRVPSKVLDPISARAAVIGSADKSSLVAIVVVDSIGLPKNVIDKITGPMGDKGPLVQSVVVSSTHDESAPDALGLWGYKASVSGVNDFYMDYVVAQANQAIQDAYAAMVQANLRFARAFKPASFQTIWSSYPFVEQGDLMTMQAVRADDTSKAIFTLVDYGFHAEGNGYSKDPSINTGLSADWPGVFRNEIEAQYGGVGMALAGLVGSVETPQVFQGESVSAVPVDPPLHTPADDEYSIYPGPTGKTAIPDGTLAETNAIGHEVASAVISALSRLPQQWSQAGDVNAVKKDVCLPVENQNFILGALAGVIARPTKCNGMSNTTPSTVAVVDVGDAQLLYVPGEVFPYTLVGGFLGNQDLPFPGLPMDADANDPAPDGPTGYPARFVAAAVARPYAFYVGLGNDMVGYIMPAADFVGGENEVSIEPWASYETKHTDLKDKFGYVHNDDPEALGPHAARAMVIGLMQAIKAADKDGAPSTSLHVGRFVDRNGAFSRSPYKSKEFQGAIGIAIDDGAATKWDAKKASLYLISGGTIAGVTPTGTIGGYLDFFGLEQNQGYSMSTRGAWIQKSDGTLDRRVFVDVYPD